MRRKKDDTGILAVFSYKLVLSRQVNHDRHPLCILHINLSIKDK